MADTARHLDARDAEQSVLGGVLLDNATLDRVASVLRPEDFANPRHRTIWERMIALADARSPIDTVTLASALEQAGDLEGIGGIEYLLSVSDSVATTINVEHHAKIIHERGEVRRLVSACAGIIGKANSGDYEDTGRLIDEAQQAVYEIGQTRTQKAFVPLKDALKAAIDQVREAHRTKRAVTGMPTGFVDLDNLTAGLQAGDLIIVGARPSMGKTSFALNIATNSAQRSGLAVAVFSLEMPTTQIVSRLLASEARVQFAAMRSGHIDDGAIQHVVEAVGRMRDWRIFVDDTAGLTVMEARAKCRRLASDKSIGGLGLIVIDYLQLMRGNPNSKSREQEISEISRSLKALAKELMVPVVALAQLSRSVESRTDKRPMMSDLRESGAIEQDADVIMFIYRDEVYNKDTDEAGVAEIIVGKQRNGPIGNIKLKFFKEFTKFENLSSGG